jgi:DNA-binding NarL/FixJ family response regulator
MMYGKLQEKLNFTAEHEQLLQNLVIDGHQPGTNSDMLETFLQLYETLTDTEKELLHPLADGLTAAQIAAERSVEESTIRTHIKHMKDKLSVTGEHMLITDLRRVSRVLTVLNPINLLE